ncbi:MAG: LamG domain-containing protein, partial [Thermofilaceae archaeon]
MKARGALLPLLLVLLLSAAAACAPQTAGQGTLEVVDHFIDYSGLSSWDENCTVAGGVLRLRSPVYEPYNTSGLVLWLHFDEESGNIAYDSSGHGNNGMIYGASRVDGKFGRAIYCDGVDDRVVVPNSASLNPTSEATWAFWVNLRRGDGVYKCVIAKYGYDSSLGVYTGWDFYVDPWNQFVFYFRYPQSISIGDVNPVFYAWSFYALVNNGTHSWLYRNGALIAEKDMILPSPTLHSITIGSRGPALYGDHIIDEVRIYSRALTADEIAFEYNNGKLYRTRTVAASRDMLSGVGPVYPVALRVAATVPYGAEARIQYSLDGGASWSSWHSLTTGVSRIA